jgi:hypothetical protein
MGRPEVVDGIKQELPAHVSIDFQNILSLKSIYNLRWQLLFK